MSRHIKTTIGCLAALCLQVAGSTAHATESNPVATAEVAARPMANPLGAKPVDLRTLASQRGGTDLGSMSEMKLSGVVSDNHAANLTTGNNVITDGAFSGVSGVPLIVQNSGNNVLIQSATIINVQLK